MAHTFEVLVTMQQAADEAHARVLALRDEYGPPTAAAWSDEQTVAYEQAWQEWRKLAGEVQAAITEHAGEQGLGRYDVEMDVKKKARHPEGDG
ncbi:MULTISPECIES: hypothetical protein [Streptomyces]|uniref:WXG100 family type VII secretion target n=2 Tax=Streptomyces TaxID=1883 RepID=A0A2U9NZ42_STRAS|nr:hypothetical protein [Streptomyces actuosus]AWT42532.1 hypothetical protein DMT42_09540 [Streptomyces actuosus]MBM4819734.1 hypothetical protein [Streptomyces actuosus]